MIPIYEQGTGKGIGHSAKTFLKRFEEISIDHITSGNAKALAFIFYDFQDKDFKKILKSQEVFVRLDRLSGKDLSIFYLHSGRDRILREFNETLLTALGVREQVQIPCVVFCKATPDGFSDISIALLNTPDLIQGFHELYSLIEAYIENGRSSFEPKYISWFKGSLKFISLEVISSLINALINMHIK